MNKLFTFFLCILVPAVAFASTDVEQLQLELQQANEIVKLIQKQYEELKQRNNELEQENAYLNSQLVLKEADLRSMNANCGRSHVNNPPPQAATTPQNPQQTMNRPMSQFVNQSGNQQVNQPINQPSNQPTTQPRPAQKPKPANTIDVGQLTPVRDLTLYAGENGAEMYVGPGSNYPRLMKLQAGAVLNVEAMQNDWFKVLTIGGIIGFVNKKHVTESKPTDGTNNLLDGKEAF